MEVFSIRLPADLVERLDMLNGWRHETLLHPGTSVAGPPPRRLTRAELMRWFIEEGARQLERNLKAHEEARPRGKGGRR